jgi:CheY-like chemotaxis protein
MATNRLNIFVADDDLDDLYLLQTALSEVSCNVNLTTAKDGIELMNLLDELPVPDAIVLDLNMPKKTGKECLKQIRSNAEFVDVPIVILSTSASAKDKDQCVQLGADFYFQKPSSFDAMKVIAKQICNSESSR